MYPAKIFLILKQCVFILLFIVFFWQIRWRPCLLGTRAPCSALCRIYCADKSAYVISKKSYLVEPKITFLVTFGTVPPFVCYCDLVEWVSLLRALVIRFSPAFKLPLRYVFIWTTIFWLKVMALVLDCQQRVTLLYTRLKKRLPGKKKWQFEQ